MQPFFVIIKKANKEESGLNPERARRRDTVLQNGHVATHASHNAVIEKSRRHFAY